MSEPNLIVREYRRDVRGAETTHQVIFRVDDVDAVLEAARGAGVDARGNPHDWEYGERQAGFIDPFGHKWVPTQTMRDIDPQDWGGDTAVPRR